jgi:hypothetical protein
LPFGVSWVGWVGLVAAMLLSVVGVFFSLDGESELWRVWRVPSPSDGLCMYGRYGVIVNNAIRFVLRESGQLFVVA